jgi:hypothetical protein
MKATLKVATFKVAFIFAVCQMWSKFSNKNFVLSESLNKSTSISLNEMLSRSYDPKKIENLVFKILGAETFDWCPEPNHEVNLSFNYTPENVMHRGISCANAYTRLLKMAMCLNPRITLGLFSSSSGAAIKKERNIEMNLKKMVELLQIATNQELRPIHRRHELVRKVSSYLLLLENVNTALFWWRLQENRKANHIFAKSANLPKSCPQAFQSAVPLLLQQDEDEAAAAVLDLLSGIERLRSSLSSERAIRECMLTEARVHLLRKGFQNAMHKLQALLTRHKGKDDALAMEGVCLLNHAREALLVWDGYEEHYARLSSVLSALFRSDAPYACQCIAPFSALSSPLSPAVMLNVAASAARRELARLTEVRSVAEKWYLVSAGLLAASPGVGGQRLRVGYVTSEFGDNSVGREIAAVAGEHDKERVAVACFFLSPADGRRPPARGKHDSAEDWRRRMARCVWTAEAGARRA